MRIFVVGFILASVLATSAINAQPWKNPLMMTWSADGVTFGTASVFQDSSGVPSIIRWHGDTIIATFQWFRQPNPSPSWDRVAVKFSYNNGLSWTPPVPIVVNAFPVNFQRPFDPTLVRIANDSLRIYFSSSISMPPPGGDSIINTYSARSADGINYTFEAGARVDVDTNRVIDPAVINFNGAWHYLSPAGAPQQGAYHYISPNGFNFSATPLIPSDNMHNWTGNYVVENSTELRFYGSSPNFIWYNTSPNGGVWNGYVNTNVRGGDPTVLKDGANGYLMIYTGPPYATGIPTITKPAIKVYPNPALGKMTIQYEQVGSSYILRDLIGQEVSSGTLDAPVTHIDLSGLSTGVYVLFVEGLPEGIKLVKQ
jgi:hypothetical protein